MRILLVEDNPGLSQFLISSLGTIGHAVDHTDNGRDAIYLAESRNYDIIIMDRMLPDSIDGLVLIGALRQMGNRTPVLILSALTAVDERIRGLRAGSDDYVIKPFAFGELTARIDALIRRAEPTEVESMLVLCDLRIHLSSYKVTCADKVVDLRPREFKLLQYLMRNANRVVTRKMLLEHVWNYDFDPQTNVVDVQISNLRQKIGISARTALKTIRNVGYTLAAAE